MRFEAFNLLFPVVLGIHNFDEYAGYDDFAAAYYARLPKKLTRRRVVWIAATLLTATAAVIAGLTYLYQSDVLIGTSKTAICALAINAVGHCVLSIRRRMLLPGTLSACNLVIPYSAIAIALMGGGIVRFALLGAVTTPLVIFCFLWIGYKISRLSRDDTNSRTGRLTR